MNIEQLHEYCLSKKGAVEDYPFGEETLCFKVAGKIFAITSFSIPLSVNLKCDPELAMDLRERFEDVQPGFHMNKKHWNTVITDGGIPDREIKKMIDHSYELIVTGLNKKQRDLLEKSD
ncbi:MAG: MmcQ/YjbR family DNA-binding protein [Bacteroidetes bacterium]|nr:MmcQ/YjbR family DNA-binding protein [Bacteroidota bacterium]